MKKDKVHIPSRKKSMVETEQVVKVSPEAYIAEYCDQGKTYTAAYGRFQCL